MNRSLSFGIQFLIRLGIWLSKMPSLPMENKWVRRRHLSSLAWWERPEVLDLEKLQTLPLSCYLTLSALLALSELPYLQL